MKNIIIASVLSLVSFGTFAQSCETGSKTPADVAICYEKLSYSDVISKFNKLRELSKEQLSYDKNILNRVDASQKSWLKYRDDYCSVYSSFHDEMNNHANCIVQLNKDRSKQIQSNIDSN